MACGGCTATLQDGYYDATDLLASVRQVKLKMVAASVKHVQSEDGQRNSMVVQRLLSNSGRCFQPDPLLSRQTVSRAASHME